MTAICGQLMEETLPFFFPGPVPELIYRTSGDIFKGERLRTVFSITRRFINRHRAHDRHDKFANWSYCSSNERSRFSSDRVVLEN